MTTWNVAVQANPGVLQVGGGADVLVRGGYFTHDGAIGAAVSPVLRRADTGFNLFQFDFPALTAAQQLAGVWFDFGEEGMLFPGGLQYGSTTGNPIVFPRQSLTVLWRPAP